MNHEIDFINIYPYFFLLLIIIDHAGLTVVVQLNPFRNIVNIKNARVSPQDFMFYNIIGSKFAIIRIFFACESVNFLVKNSDIQ